MRQAILFMTMLLACLITACSSQKQQAFTKDSNYFDYEYYGIQNREFENTFGTPYDYYYYEEPEYFYDEAAPPVYLQEAPPEPAGDAWFFEDGE